jgi:2-methylcitrate dehydratase
LIDLAFEMRERIDPGQIEETVLHTSHHTHDVVGTGANDPQKMDPDASRETLDHSIMYILAVALEDGRWHHVDSYTPERAHRPSTVALWHKIRTVEDPDWTARYHAPDPAERQFGGRLEIRMADGGVVTGEIGVAHAHPNGKHPWGLDDYVGKFRDLSAPTIDAGDADAFIDRVRDIRTLDATAIRALHPVLPTGTVKPETGDGGGIFDYDQ